MSVEHGATPADDDDSEGVDVERREFLKVAVTASAVLAAAGVGAIAKSITNPAPPGSGSAGTATTFPKLMVANISDLQVNTPVSFNYPLDNEPSFLVKLGQPAEQGVGPDGDIVAFSQVCQHLGCIYGFQATGVSPPCQPSYKPPSPVGYCCCHGSTYDLLHEAKVIGGPAPRPVPMVILEVDTSSGDIYATGMTPPAIFGHDTGSTDVTNDLQGGDLVGQGGSTGTNSTGGSE